LATDHTGVALERRAAIPVYARDCYLSLIQMLVNSSSDIEKHYFDAVFEGRRKKRRRSSIPTLTAQVGPERRFNRDYKNLVERRAQPFPQDAREQLVS